MKLYRIVVVVNQLKFLMGIIVHRNLRVVAIKVLKQACKTMMANKNTYCNTKAQVAILDLKI